MQPVQNFTWQAGLVEAIEAAGIGCAWIGGVFMATDPVVAAAIQGSFDSLGYAKTQKQALLDIALNTRFDLVAFIRAGSSQTITAANIGSFLATITNNYRSLRSRIASAADLPTLVAIDLNTGWPSNP